MKPEYTLTRLFLEPDGTFGELKDSKGTILCLTCEDPWKNNEKGVSCIPEGTYEFIRYSGSKYKNVWMLLKVPNRDAILIHQGNTHLDTQGCILVGNKHGNYKGFRAVLNSLVTLQWLRGILPTNGYITIRYAQGVKP